MAERILKLSSILFVISEWSKGGKGGVEEGERYCYLYSLIVLSLGQKLRRRPLRELLTLGHLIVSMRKSHTLRLSLGGQQINLLMHYY